MIVILGATIREKRLYMKLAQSAFPGITPKRMAEIENGEIGKEITKKEVEIISKVLGISIQRKDTEANIEDHLL
jgi:hypothetical protein